MSALLPIPFVGLIVGAICAGVAISAMCGMTLKRSIIAASIYLAIQVCISLLFTTKGALYVRPWLDGIRWVPEVIAAEDEYRLSVGTCASYDPPKTP